MRSCKTRSNQARRYVETNCSIRVAKVQPTRASQRNKAVAKEKPGCRSHASTRLISRPPLFPKRGSGCCIAAFFLLVFLLVFRQCFTGSHAGHGALETFNLLTNNTRQPLMSGVQGHALGSEAAAYPMRLASVAMPLTEHNDVSDASRAVSQEQECPKRI